MNEVNILNIGGIDYNVDDQLARDVIAHSENGLDPQSNLPISSRHYDEGDYLIGQDRLYYEVTSDIEIGDVIAEGVNVRATIISEELVRLKNQSSIAVIQSIAKVESGALSSRGYTVGQYFYWDFGLAAGLYETIATITSGDAFSVGVNIKLADKIADTMDGLQDAYNITGAKNLCPNNAVDTVTTDITWDVLSDGSIQVSGTPAANRFLELGYVTLPPGTYKVTTLAGQDEENSRVWLTVYAGSGYSNVIARSNSSSGTPNTFTLAIEATIKMALNVSSGAAINTRIFPMCRVASITDESYVPYAMTNRQLTSQIIGLASIYRYTNPTDIINPNAPLNSAFAVKQNQIVNININFGNYQLVNNVWTVLGVLTPKFRPLIQQNFNAVSNTDGRSFQARIDHSGNIQIWVPSTITHSALISLTYFTNDSDH